ncbi:MAG TPA: HEAT repeat domain-containing protein [Rubrobacteraceae bacterium]|nr:HEAT repeat domain-containing protein [Rubrobacteraceae bacterium]
MDNLTLIWIAVSLMILLNVLMVVLTLGIKALRSVRQRTTESRKRRLESALENSIFSGETDPSLLKLDGRDLDLLASLMIDYLYVLSGEQRDRLVRLAEEVGLVRRYLERLRARGRWRKARAAENLGHFGGPETIAPLAQLLLHPDETLRAVAARALARIGTPEAARELARRLSDPSELTRLRMAENLARIGHPSVEPLIEVLEEARDNKESRPYGPVQASQVLGQLRAPEARQALGDAALLSQSVDLRAKSTQALGKIGDPDDLPKLFTAAEDEAWPVRAQAASSLGVIGDLAAIPVLRNLTLDREWWVRLNASRSLANMGPDGERALTSLLEHDDRYARDRAAATLEERGITRRVAEELSAPGERGESARAMIRAMVRAGATRYLGRLANTMSDEDARITLGKILMEETT